MRQLKNFAGKSGSEAAVALNKTFVPMLLDRLPIMRAEGLAMLYGSTVMGTSGPGSDIDVMLFLPERFIRSREPELNRLSEQAWDEFSVDLVFRYPLELLNSDRFWGDDFLLYCLWQGVALYDRQGILPGRKTFFSNYSAEVLRDKIISCGSEIMRWLMRLEKYSALGDNLGIVSMRTKLIKLNIILLHLRHNLYFDSHNLSAALNIRSELFSQRVLVESCVRAIGSPECDEFLVRLTEAVQAEVVSAGLLPEKFFGTWRQRRQPVRYPLRVSWL